MSLTSTDLHPVWQVGRRQPSVPVMPSRSDPQATSAAGKHLERWLSKGRFQHFRFFLLRCLHRAGGPPALDWTRLDKTSYPSSTANVLQPGSSPRLGDLRSRTHAVAENAESVGLAGHRFADALCTMAKNSQPANHAKGMKIVGSVVLGRTSQQDPEPQETYVVYSGPAARTRQIQTFHHTHQIMKTAQLFACMPLKQPKQTPRCMFCLN